MKKSVIFLIGVLYIISIIVVTFFGLQATIDQFQVYMNSISITSYDQIVNDNKYLIVNFNDTEGYTSVFIEYDYTPSNATHPDRVSFSLVSNTYVDENGETAYYAQVSATGEVVFYARRTVKLVITTTDGSKLTDSLMIICR